MTQKPIETRVLLFWN